jgi:hypothetical protein
LDDQKAKDLPELQKLENALGWKVEGVKREHLTMLFMIRSRRVDKTPSGTTDNTLLMRFTEIDPVDHEREFSLVLDVANDDYVGESVMTVQQDGVVSESRYCPVQCHDATRHYRLCLKC